MYCHIHTVLSCHYLTLELASDTKTPPCQRTCDLPFACPQHWFSSILFSFGLEPLKIVRFLQFPDPTSFLYWLHRLVSGVPRRTAAHISLQITDMSGRVQCGSRIVRRIFNLYFNVFRCLPCTHTMAASVHAAKLSDNTLTHCKQNRGFIGLHTCESCPTKERA